MSEVNVKDVAEKLRKFPFTRHFRVRIQSEYRILIV